MYGEVLAHQSKAAHVGGKTDQQIEARCWHRPGAALDLAQLSPRWQFQQ